MFTLNFSKKQEQKNTYKNILIMPVNVIKFNLKFPIYKVISVKNY